MQGMYTIERVLTSKSAFFAIVAAANIPSRGLFPFPEHNPVSVARCGSHPVSPGT